MSARLAPMAATPIRRVWREPGRKTDPAAAGFCLRVPMIKHSQFAVNAMSTRRNPRMSKSRFLLDAATAADKLRGWKMKRPPPPLA